MFLINFRNSAERDKSLSPQTDKCPSHWDAAIRRVLLLVAPIAGYYG